MYENYERVSEMWRLTICPVCHCLLYKYPTKGGSAMKVSVYSDMTFHRYGNNNNYVPMHDCCNGDRRPSQNRKYMIINCLEVPEDIRDRVKGAIQQQAVVKALKEYSKKGIRSKFKKGMLEQAKKFLAGESQYKYPYSPAQAISIVLGSA